MKAQQLIDDQTNLKLHKDDNSKLIVMKPSADFVHDLITMKKAKHLKQQRLSRLFFNIGLFISLSFLTLVFEWRSYETHEFVELTSASIFDDEFLEIPPTEQLPPEPLKVLQQPTIVEVPDEEEILEEIKINLDVNIDEETAIEPVAIMDLEEPVEEKADEVFTIVEVKPEPKGGIKAFYTYVAENIRYPSSAMRVGVEGRVFVQFIVNKDGSFTEMKVVKGIGMGCDEEALRVIKGAPAWSPGKQRGKPVRVRMILPINFIMAKN